MKLLNKMLVKGWLICERNEPITTATLTRCYL